jgi:hypothetical protein
MQFRAQLCGGTHQVTMHITHRYALHTCGGAPFDQGCQSPDVNRPICPTKYNSNVPRYARREAADWPTRKPLDCIDNGCDAHEQRVCPSEGHGSENAPEDTQQHPKELLPDAPAAQLRSKTP